MSSIISQVWEPLQKNCPNVTKSRLTRTPRRLSLQVCVCSVVQSCPTLVALWTVACQAPLSVGFSRQEYWSRLPFPYPREDIPTQGSNPLLLCLLHLPVNSLTLSHLGSPFICTGPSQSFVSNYLFVILHFFKKKQGPFKLKRCTNFIYYVTWMGSCTENSFMQDIIDTVEYIWSGDWWLE